MLTKGTALFPIGLRIKSDFLFIDDIFYENIFTYDI